MLIWTLAKKDLRLLLRDPRAMVVLLAMPLIFILVLGVSLGEGFGQKPDDRLRISVVDLDEPFRSRCQKRWRSAMVENRGARPGANGRHSRGDRFPRWKKPKNWSATASGPR